MTYLGSRQASGLTGDPTNPFGAGKYTVRFDPAVLGIPQDYEVYHIALQGPAGSTVRLYVDTAFYGSIARGDINDWDPAQPLFVNRGQTLSFFWSVGTGPAPLVSVWCRTPSPL